MLKTNKFKTLAVLLATILGLTGITSTVYADKTSDKKTVANMALTYSKYQTFTSLEALDWANRNMITPAVDNPFRNSMPNKNPLCILTIGEQTVLGTHNVHHYNALVKKVVLINNSRNAYVVLKRTVEPNSIGAQPRYDMSEKIWFKKVNNSWKISNYYTLLNDLKVNGVVKNSAGMEEGFFGCNRFGFDSKGTNFPY